MATRDGREGANQDIPNHGVPEVPSVGAPIARKGTPESSNVRNRLLCSWCGEIQDVGDPGAPTSHTCCLRCDARIRSAEGLPPAEAESQAVAR